MSTRKFTDWLKAFIDKLVAYGLEIKQIPSGPPSESTLQVWRTSPNPRRPTEGTIRALHAKLTLLLKKPSFSGVKDDLPSVEMLISWAKEQWNVDCLRRGPVRDRQSHRAKAGANKLEEAPVRDLSEGEQAVADLNKLPFLSNVLKICVGPTLLEPALLSSGSLKLSNRVDTVAKNIADDLANRRRPNDPVAVLTQVPFWSDNPLTFHYHALHYSQSTALRRTGKKLIRVSAVCVLFCEEKRVVYVHRRASESEDHPSTLHVFGGSYMPPGIGPRGDRSLRECAIRETLEEAAMSFSIPKATPMIVIHEIAIDFVQTAFLGVNLSTEEADRIEGSWEGAVSAIPFDQLVNQLARVKDWTHSGWTNLMVWLSLGAPSVRKALQFGDSTPQQAYKKVLERLR